MPNAVREGMAMVEQDRDVPETSSRDSVGRSQLGFAQTVDRALVHRTCVAEVFITDVRPAGPREADVAAQLPLMHLYYGDHVQEPSLVDPVLLLEAGRQAAICGVHTLGIPMGSAMLVNEFSLRVHDLEPLRIGRSPVDVRITNRFTETRMLRDRFRAGRVDQELSIGPRSVATHTMQVQILRDAEYAALRKAQRRGRVPSTSDLPQEQAARPLTPAQVGRSHPINVVLSDLDRIAAAGTVSARVTPMVGNRALFDHDYDHLPALALTEASRQLALAGVDDGTGTVIRGTYPSGLAAAFTGFVELDAPVTAIAVIPAETMPFGVDVSIVQTGRTVATAAIDLVDLRAVA